MIEKEYAFLSDNLQTFPEISSELYEGENEINDAIIDIDENSTLFMQIWQNYAEGMSILALSLLARYCVKSTMMDLSPNNTVCRSIS